MTALKPARDQLNQPERTTQGQVIPFRASRPSTSGRPARNRC
jgi:hypothetical protein